MSTVTTIASDDACTLPDSTAVTHTRQMPSASLSEPSNVTDAVAPATDAISWVFMT